MGKHEDAYRVLIPEKDRERALVVSASHFDTFELCPKKWAYRYEWDLQEPERGFLGFGTALHGVVERWLLADDLGRGSDGEPVDIYPEGWEVNEKGAVSPADQVMIQRLVKMAIEAGVLQRQAGRQIEHRFVERMGEWDDVPVYCGGTVDVLLPDKIGDHKTTKSRNYIKSPKKLRTNTQMLLYARKLLLLRDEWGWPRIDEVGLEHYVYCKDKDEPFVKKVEARATRQEIDDRWTFLTDVVKQMLLVRQIRDYHALPDPPTTGACLAYGGCPYMIVCSGRENPEQYRIRMDRVLGNTNDKEMLPMVTKAPFAKNIGKPSPAAANAPPVGTPTINGPPAAPKPPAPPAKAPPPKAPAPKPVLYWVPNPQDPNGTPVSVTAEEVQKDVSADPSLLETLPLMKQGEEAWKNPAAYGFAVVEVATAGEPWKEGSITDGATATLPTEPETPKLKTMGTPPWANPACGSCAGSGFSTSGSPCRICAVDAEKDGRPSPDGFRVTVADGVISWKAKEAKAPAPAKPPTVAAPAPKSVPAPKAPEVPAPAGEETANEGEEGGEAKPEEGKQGGKGRPKKGFVLLINVAPTKGPGNTVLIGELFAKWAKVIADANKVDSYYKLETWSRRDKIKENALTIAAELGCVRVVANTSDPDEKHLRDALRPYAYEVLEGVAI